jgi:hypothetical protein
MHHTATDGQYKKDSISAQSEIDDFNTSDLKNPCERSS